mmetsp:Transcript_1142/g.1322  ORF Transcript_1142/g.1322 Transcript_1142/m.1322 type:complete len:89 (-) Transcript_1142:252-518(-)
MRESNGTVRITETATVTSPIRIAWYNFTSFLAINVKPNVKSKIKTSHLIIAVQNTIRIMAFLGLDRNHSAYAFTTRPSAKEFGNIRDP